MILNAGNEIKYIVTLKCHFCHIKERITVIVLRSVRLFLEKPSPEAFNSQEFL